MIEATDVLRVCSHGDYCHYAGAEPFKSLREVCDEEMLTIDDDTHELLPLNV